MDGQPTDGQIVINAEKAQGITINQNMYLNADSPFVYLYADASAEITNVQINNNTFRSSVSDKANTIVLSVNAQPGSTFIVKDNLWSNSIPYAMAAV